MTLQIKKAVRAQKKIRINIVGPSGSGKTNTALELAKGLGEKVIVIDSEHGRASLFGDLYSFDTIELESLQVEDYLKALELCSGYDVVVIDSTSHAWDAVNDAVQVESAKTRGGNSFQTWGKVGTPLYQKLIQTIITHPAHIITTMRVKSDYVMEEYTDGSGKTKTKPVKVGLAPKFREGGEYEFDLTGNMDMDHNLIIEKSPPGLGLDGKVINKPSAKLGKQILDWISGGAAAIPISPPSKSNGVAASRPIIPENPWMWKLQGDSEHKGKYLAALPDDKIEALKEEQFRKSLLKTRMLSKYDDEAILECFKNYDALTDARSQILDAEDYNGRIEGE